MSKLIIDDEQLTTDAEYIDALVIGWIDRKTKIRIDLVEKSVVPMARVVAASPDHPRRPR